MKGTAETRTRTWSAPSSPGRTISKNTSAAWKPATAYPSRNWRKLRWEEYRTEDAELIVVGYGIVSRVLRSAVDQARKQGMKVGLFRPITLWPFPSKQLEGAALRAEKLLVVELSNGQMVEDVRLGLNGQRPIEFYGRVGSSVPSVEELLTKMEEQMPVAV